MPLRLLKRISLKDTLVGKVVQIVGGIVGVGGTAGILTDSFQITGDQIVDIVYIICATISLILAGKVPVAPEDQDKIEKN